MNMKKIFAAFCALVLMPSFSAQAWIGGPFSNNSYFGEDGDDGVYEAVAYPVGGAFANGIGIFRWGVGNSTAFTDDATISVSSVVYDDEGNITGTFVNIRPIASNIYFGGTGQVSHTWFLEGIAYRGNCDGIVNSGLGVVSCIGSASSPSSSRYTISSGFEGTIDNKGEGLPVTRFSGRGNGRSLDLLDPNATVNFRFVAFGTKVSSYITANGMR